MEEKSLKEQRIRRITHLYYSRPDIQKAIFEFAKDREVVPSYMMESFGKRPDSLQYPNDMYGLVKEGATSFHCSQELWKEPLSVATGMNEKQLAELRIGWDLILDIDSKYLDYSKILAEIVIKVLRFYGVKNVGIKFSGSKGFHLIVPWKAFPKTINGVETSSMFPTWPRILTQFIMEVSKPDLVKRISEAQSGEDYDTVKKYISKNVAKPIKLESKLEDKSGHHVTRIGSSQSDKSIENTKEKELEILRKRSDFEEQVMPDLILVSSRHLFRMPYSLHEKTALASVVLDPNTINDFQPRDADPVTAKVKNFTPEAEEGEASEILREALDWYKNKMPETTETLERKDSDYKPVKLNNVSDENFPPSIKKMLQGMSDGRKRGLFILINFFRAIGLDREDLEKRLYQWNEKNEVPLKVGYIKAQLSWSYRNKLAPPPNYDKDYYKGIGIVPTEEELRYKNPVNYTIRKTMQKNPEDLRQSNKSRKAKTAEN